MNVIPFKAATDAAITSKTAPNTIDPADVGGQINALADLTKAAVESLGNFVPVTGTVLPNLTDTVKATTIVGAQVSTQTTGGSITTVSPVNVLVWNGVTWTLSKAFSVADGSILIDVPALVLPNPTSVSSAFAFVGAGTFTQTTGGSLVLTSGLNILMWNGTTWSLTEAIHLPSGWSPTFAIATDGLRRVQQLTGYVGGEGAAPTGDVGKYVGASGYVTLIANGVDIRGIQGIQGVDGTANFTPWAAGVYAINSQVRHLNKAWISNGATVAGDVPGTAAVWLKLFNYADEPEFYLSTNDAYWNSALDINTATGKATLTNGYVLSRGRNLNVTVAGGLNQIDITLGNDFYVFWIDIVTGVFGYSVWSAYVNNSNKLVLCRMQKQGVELIYTVTKNNVAFLTVNGSIHSLSSAVGRISDIETELSQVSNDTIWLNSVTINTTTGVATTTSGFMLSRRNPVNITVTNPSLNFTFTNNNYYAFWINVSTGLFGYSVYNSTLLKDKNLLILFRIFTPTTGVKIQFNLCVSLVVNGIDLGRQAQFDSITTVNNINSDLTKKISLAAKDAIWTTDLAINTTTNVATLTAGYILSRTVSQNFNPASTTLAITLLNANFYVFWFDTVTNVFGYSLYNAYPAIDSKDKFILCRIRMASATSIEVQANNVCNLLLNGTNFGIVSMMNSIPSMLARLTALETAVSAPILDAIYVEIGDSLSWQYDGKLENFASQGAGTGYRAIGGYGQKIRQVFGISYANHASHGLNGHTFAEWIASVNTPPNSDLVYQVPKNGDIYSVFLGTNDFGKAEPLGTKLDYLNNTLSFSNVAGTKTIYGALRRLVDYITDTSTSTKDKKIVFITPPGFGSYLGYTGGVTSTWQYDSNGEIVEKTNAAGVKMSDIVTAIRFAASQIGAYVIDLYGQQGLTQKQRLNIQGTLVGGIPAVYQGVSNDNLHFTLKGQKWLGNYTTDELKKIIVLDTF